MARERPQHAAVKAAQRSSYRGSADPAVATPSAPSPDDLSFPRRGFEQLARAVIAITRAPLIWAALLAAAVALSCVVTAQAPYSPFTPVAFWSFEGWFAAREQNAFLRWTQLGGDVHALVRSGDALVAVADTGIYRSRSAGRFWTQVDRTPALRGISAVGEQLWAVGADAAIRYSADGGNSWQGQSAPALTDSAPQAPVKKAAMRVVEPDSGGNSRQQDKGYPSLGSEPVVTRPLLSAVQFRDAMTGWAVGARGAILATVDGGRSWQWQERISRENLHAVHFFNVSLGWAVGDNGTILASTDGGRSWQLQRGGSDESFQDVAFADATTGWVVGSGGAIVATRDAGISWQAQTSGTRDWLQQLTLIDAQTGWAVGERGVLVATRDGGASWQAQTSTVKAWLSDIVFADAQHGWAVGSNGTVISTRDGGARWQKQAGDSRGELIGLSFVDAARGWVVGSSGSLLATRDGGRHWSALARATDANLIGVHFHDGNTGWTVGEPQALLQTRDGGASWQAQPTGSSASLIDIVFVDASTGWAVGESGTVLASRDGGASWQLQQSNTANDLFDLAFIDATAGWAVGLAGVIVHTRDGGASWQAQRSGTDDDLIGVAFVDADTGWAVGAGGTILATRDGGNSWQRQASGVEADLTGLHFVDRQRGWAVGDGGTIVHTGDGGRSWQRQDSGVAAALARVVFRDGNTGWIVGESGTILRTQDGGASWQAPAYRQSWPLAVYGFAGLALALLLRHGQRHGNSQATTAVEQRSRLLEPGSNDNTVRHVRDDKLDTGKIARSLSWFLQNRSTQAPLTLAVTGGWGSGKSSVMRMMQSDLHDAGYRTIWFNAWHQNSEETMLAALMETLRKHGIPPWYTLSGCWFGSKLIARRLLRPLLYVLILAVLLLVLVQLGYRGGVPRFQQHWQQGWQHATAQQARRDREKRPLTVDAAFLDSLTVQAPLLEKFRERRFDSPKALEEALNKALDQRAEQLAETAAEPAPASADMAAIDAFLRAFHQHYYPAALPDGSPLATRIANRLHEIWEDMQGLLLGGGAAGATLLALLTLKNSLSALGNANGWRLFRHRINPLAVEADPGLRYRMQRALEELARAFGRRRLVIFVDDVDRCPPKQQRKVLEIANTLHAASDGMQGRGFFIVLGAALDVVVPSIASDMQEEVAESVAHVAGSNEAEHRERLRAARVERARHYLEKIVNMEVHIAATSDDHLGGLFSLAEAAAAGPTANVAQTGNTENTENTAPPQPSGFWEWLARKRNVIDHWTLPVALLVLVAVGVSWMAGDWSATAPAAAEPSGSRPVQTIASDAATVPTEVMTAPQRERGARASPAAGFVARELATGIDWAELLALVLLLLAAVIATALAVLKKLEVRDRRDFIDALKIWSPVIGVRERTPRHVKRASNQLRYFSMRVREQLSDAEQADQLCVLLVAIRALRDVSTVAAKDDARQPLWRALLAGSWQTEHGRARRLLMAVALAEGISLDHTEQVLEQAWAEHERIFGRPDADTWQRAIASYETLSEGIVLR